MYIEDIYITPFTPTIPYRNASIKCPRAYLIFEPPGWALIRGRGGRLFEGGALIQLTKIKRINKLREYIYIL